MFTGIIKKTCLVESVSRSPDGMQLRIALGELADESKPGDSISVNGVCLTVTELSGRVAHFDISGETLGKTTLGSLRPSSEVNIELALKSTDRLGGHIVQGHIDGTAQIKRIEQKGKFKTITFSADTELLEEMVLKGSVAVDGISLTVAGINGNSFGVAVIPETLERTTLGRAKAAESVNIETDIIIKAVRKQLEKIMPAKQELTVEKLKELGF